MESHSICEKDDISVFSQVYSVVLKFHFFASQNLNLDNSGKSVEFS